MHWPRVFRAAIQHDDLPFLASPLECCDCVADFARRGPYSLCASRRMVFNAPQRDLTLSLYKIRKGLSPTCSQRIEVSRAVLVHETGQWIFERALHSAQSYMSLQRHLVLVGSVLQCSAHSQRVTLITQLSSTSSPVSHVVRSHVVRASLFTLEARRNRLRSLVQSEYTVVL